MPRRSAPRVLAMLLPLGLAACEQDLTTATPVASAPAEAQSEGDALVPGTGYHATGTVGCWMTPGQLSANCPFGVVRRGGGNATVTISTPDGGTREVTFAGGEATGATGGSGQFQSARKDDETMVAIGEERYLIPDAVVNGG